MLVLRSDASISRCTRVGKSQSDEDACIVSEDDHSSWFAASKLMHSHSPSLNPECTSLVAKERPLNADNSQLTPTQPSLFLWFVLFPLLLRAEETSHVSSSALLKMDAFHNSNPPQGTRAKVSALLGAEHLAPPKRSPEHFIHTSSSIKASSHNLTSACVCVMWSWARVFKTSLDQSFCSAFSFFKSFFYRYILIGITVWRRTDDLFQTAEFPGTKLSLLERCSLKKRRMLKIQTLGSNFAHPPLVSTYRDVLAATETPLVFWGLSISGLAFLGSWWRIDTVIFTKTSQTFLILFHLFITLSKRSSHDQVSRLAFCPLPGEPYKELCYTGAQERGGSLGEENQGPVCRQKL